LHTQGPSTVAVASALLVPPSCCHGVFYHGIMQPIPCACLPACLLACLLACLPACLPACLLACLPACLPACEPTSQPECLPARQPANQPTSQPANQPTSQPPSQLACLPASLPPCLPERGCPHHPDRSISQRLLSTSASPRTQSRWVKKHPSGGRRVMEPARTRRQEACPRAPLDGATHSSRRRRPAAALPGGR
jgi:hypothetical protein